MMMCFVRLCIICFIVRMCMEYNRTVFQNVGMRENAPIGNQHSHQSYHDECEELRCDIPCGRVHAIKKLRKMPQAWQKEGCQPGDVFFISGILQIIDY